MKISVAMIVRNAADHLEETIKSLAPLKPDQLVIVDTGSKDATLDIAARLATNLYTYLGPRDDWAELPFIDDFADARNFSFKQCTGDVILWIDADDIVREPARLRAIIEDKFERDQMPLDVLYMRYAYEHDEVGNCTSSLWRERVVRNGVTRWARPIHEIQIPTRLCNTEYLEDEAVFIKHEATIGYDPNAARKKAVRNLWVADRYIGSFEDTEKSPEPWVWRYVGECYRELAEHENAIAAYDKYLDGSTWPDERILCRLAKSNIYKDLDRIGDAIREAKEAHLENVDNPLPWLCLAEIYNDIPDDQELLRAVKHMSVCEPLTREIVHNPIALSLKPLMLAAQAHIRMAEFDLAFSDIAKMREIAPGDEVIDQFYQFVVSQREDLDLYEAYTKVCDAYKGEGSIQADIALRRQPPKSISQFCMDSIKPFEAVGESGRIIIYCGNTAEQWGPDSLESGIGGSEEATVLLALELKKLGWGVEVYANVTKEGIHDGVAYNPYYHIEKARTPDIYIGWRVPAYLSAPVADGAAGKYAWMHDLPVREYWNAEGVYDDLDGVFLLSDYHIEKYDFLPEGLTIKSCNGISEDWLAAPAQSDLDPLRCVYGSSPDRGLEQLLKKVWPKIVEAEPDATLDVFYGFTKNYDALAQGDAKKIAWKDEMLRLLATTKGVVYHGRVGQRELAAAYAKSHFWLYPTGFGEISCITAMKAQAMGAIPCTTGYAALEETQQHGAKLPVDEMADWVVSTWNDKAGMKEIRERMIPWAREHYSWAKVASQWNDLFLEKIGTNS